MFKNLRIGARMTLGFGLVLGLLCIMAVVAIWQMGRLADNATSYAVNLVPPYETEHRVSLALANVRRMQYRHLAANAAADMDKAEAKIAEYRQSVAEGFDLYARNLVSDDQDKRLLEAAKSAVLLYYAEWDKLRPISRMTATDPSKTEEANQMILGASAQAYEATQAAIGQWWDYNVKLSRDQEVASRSTYGSAKVALLAMAGVALAMGSEQPC